MRDKNTAVLLAFFLGWVGAHRFYLGQRVLGVLYIILLFTFGISFIIALIDFIGLLAMRRDRFDYLYNKKFFDEDYLRFLEKRNETIQSSKAPMKKKEVKSGRQVSRSPLEALQDVKSKGKEHFKNYEYQEAAEIFEKALEINSRDAAVHFNLACCFSLLENKDRGFRHLALAVENGFDNIKKIKEHPSLAYLRVQDEWIPFVNNNFHLVSPIESASKDLMGSNTTEDSPQNEEGNDKILVRLRQLKDQRDRGLISNIEYEERKKEIL